MRESLKPASSDGVASPPRQAEARPVHLTVTVRRAPSRALASPSVLIYTFAGLIAIGAMLLLLPFTHHGGGYTPFMVALFTATSAATDTGLIVRDTATYWTRSGQVIILCLMFVGGLGFVTIATFLLILIGQRVTLTQRLLMRESLGVNQMGGLVRLTVGVVAVFTGIQLAGFVALFVRFIFIYPPAEAAWQSAFHAVSGFNNAGLSTLAAPGGLSAFLSDKALLGFIAALTVLGGLGYGVMVDVAKARRFSPLGLNTKLVLVLTAALLVIGAVGFLATEYRNPATLGSLSVQDKASVSIFQSVTARTSGFAVVDFGATEQQTNFMYTGLMFIGGASASTAGGVKVNTLAVALVAVLSTLRGKNHASAFGREIPDTVVQRAMVIGALSIAFVFTMALLLTFAESEFEFIALLFECVSAFGTVGLSTGLTQELSSLGQLVLVLTMFVGWIGPLTLALALAQRPEGDLYRHAQERVTIG